MGIAEPETLEFAIALYLSTEPGSYGRQRLVRRLNKQFPEFDWVAFKAAADERGDEEKIQEMIGDFRAIALDMR